MRVVLDTNVLVSALAFPGGKPDEALRYFRRGRVRLFTSEFILGETERVLREKIRLGPTDVAAAISAVRALAEIVEPSERFDVIEACRDDNRILECAVAARADTLVTGDRAHLVPLGSFRGIRIVTPAEFLQVIEGHG